MLSNHSLDTFGTLVPSVSQALCDFPTSMKTGQTSSRPKRSTESSAETWKGGRKKKWVELVFHIDFLMILFIFQKNEKKKKKKFGSLIILSPYYFSGSV